MTSPSRKNRASSNPLDPQGIGGETVAVELLALWEQGQTTAPAFRGTALAAAAAGEPISAAGDQPVGVRDRRLLELRRRLIGDSIEARATCPDCGAEIETDFGLDELLQHNDRGAETAAIAVDGLSLAVRAPTATELTQLAGSHATQEALRAALVRTCVISCTDAAGNAAEIPASADDAIASSVETLDPLAAIAVSLACPDCGSELEMPFDPAEFVWREIQVLAERLLWEIDQLARVYHWSEAEILALSKARRQAYLDMALA